jgi:nucleotide-binding universal stress UspA family protein
VISLISGLQYGTIVTADEADRIIEHGTVRGDSDGRRTAVAPVPSDTTSAAAELGSVVAGELVMHEGTVESMEPESVIEAAEDARDRLQDTTGWSTSVAGSSPPETSIARRIAARPTLRVLTQYGQGLLSEYLP